MMRSNQYKIFLPVLFCLLLMANAVLFIMARVPAQFTVILSIFYLISILGLVSYFRSQNRFLKMISDGLEIIKSGNYKYRTGIKEKDIYGRLSGTIDQIAELLEKNEIGARNQDLENEVLVDQLRETNEIQQRFQRLFENPNYGIFLCDFDGLIIDVNETGCKLLDYSIDELKELSFYDLYIPEELTRSIDAIKIGSEKRAIRFESKFKTKSNKIMDVEVSSNIYDFKNEIIQNIVSDISNRKHVERELKESEEKFRSFMESANDLMFITDEEEKIIYANPKMIQTLEMPLDILSTMHLSDLLFAEDKNNPVPNADNYTEDTIKELIWKSENGNKIYGEMMTSVILDEHEARIGWRGVFRDVTDRKKIANTYRLAQLGKLIADISHEVKNRLMAIMGIVEFVLLGQNKNSEIAQDMRMIFNECQTMNDFVRQLLNFSKPSDGTYIEANVHDVIDNVLKLISKSLKRDQIKVEKKYDPTIPLIKLDEKQMGEVFINLIQNAQEAMEKKNTVEIETFHQDNEIHIDIIDHGKGIPEAIMAKIFDPFFTTKETGTGLGVSACYGIVKAHGGELTYNSELGKGTTAHIVLPICTPE